VEVPKPWSPEGSSGPRPAGDWGPGTRVAGRYTIEAQVGEGASAVTYRARDVVLGRPVALKVLRSRFARDPETVARFEREARIAAAIAHPNVVTVYDFGTDGGAFFIALQFVAGRDLREEFEARGRLPTVDAISITRAVLAGLGAIHLAGIVHRDVKPSNILLGSDGVVRLTDFGVAHEIVADRLTSHGTTIGTAAYMAPEQARGSELSPATDLYAVGVVLFESVTGRLPFAHDNPMATLLAQIQTPPPRPRDVTPAADITSALEEVILRALAKDPRARFPTAAAMSKALADAGGAAPSPATTTRLPTATVVRPASTASGRTERLAGAAPGRSAPGSRFQPASGWSQAAGAPANSGRISPWLAAAGVALGALVVLVAVLLFDIGDGDGEGDRRTPLPAVGSAPTPTPSPTETEGIGTSAAPTATKEEVVVPPESTRRPSPTTEPEPTETTEPTITPTETVEPTEEPTETPEPPTPTEEPEPTATEEPTATATEVLVEEGPSIGSTEGGTGSAGSGLPSAQSADDGTAFEARAWVGGEFDEGSLGQPATVLDGRGSRDTQATLTFQLNVVPEDGLLLWFQLFVPEGGMGDGFLVEVNGMPFGLEGGSGGAVLPPGWTPIEIALPADLLVPGENVVSVTYDAPGGRAGQDATIGLGGGEIVPIDGGFAAGETTTGQSSSAVSGNAASQDDSESVDDDDDRNGEDDGPGPAPTIAPRSLR
jgi:serine/threonine-protein kinase